MDASQNRLVEERNHLQSGVGEPLEDYRIKWPHEQRVYDDYLFPKYRKELEIIRHHRDYNMPDGVLAQHFFHKDAYRWNYMSVLLDTYRRTSFEASSDYGDRSHERRRRSCLNNPAYQTRKFRIPKSTMKAEALKQRRANFEEHISSEGKMMSAGLREDSIKRLIERWKLKNKGRRPSSL